MALPCSSFSLDAAAAAAAAVATAIAAYLQIAARSLFCPLPLVS